MSDNNQNCIFCKSETIKIISLRHFFFKCKNCKNISRSEEKKLNIFDHFKKSIFLRRFSNFHRGKQDQFFYYLDVKISDHYKSKKFFFITGFLNNNKNIKDVLDISGGPGLFEKYKLFHRQCN